MKKHKRQDRIEKLEAEKGMMLRRLQAAGCPVPVENDCNPPPDLTIEVCNPDQTRAYDFPSGAEYVFAVRVTNHSYVRLEIREFRCQLLWPAPMIWPGIGMPEREVYLLPSGREFPSATVLNHCVGELGRLEPGATREGLLLAFSPNRRLAGECLHGAPFSAELSIFDQYSRRHRSLVDLVADRAATIDWSLFQRRRGKGLFDDGSEAGDIIRGEIESPRPEERDLPPDPPEIGGNELL